MFQGNPRIVLIGHCLAMLLRQVFPVLCLFPLHKQSLRTITDQRNLESPRASFHRTSKLRNIKRRRSSIVSPGEPSQQSPIALLQLLLIHFRRHFLPNLLPLLLKGRFLEKTRVFLAAIFLVVGVRIQTVQAVPWVRLPCLLRYHHLLQRSHQTFFGGHPQRQFLAAISAR